MLQYALAPCPSMLKCSGDVEGGLNRKVNENRFSRVPAPVGARLEVVTLALIIQQSDKVCVHGHPPVWVLIYLSVWPTLYIPNMSGTSILPSHDGLTTSQAPRDTSSQRSAKQHHSFLARPSTHPTMKPSTQPRNYIIYIYIYIYIYMCCVCVHPYSVLCWRLRVQGCPHATICTCTLHKHD